MPTRRPSPTHRVMDSDSYVIEIKGPKGVRLVEIPASQARLFSPEHDGDEYQAALFLACCDLYFKGLQES